MPLSGCVTGSVSPEAICAGTEKLRDDHTASLVQHGEAIINIGAGDVIVTGRNLIGGVDAGCDQ